MIDPPPSTGSGLLPHLSTLLAAKLSYLRARLELAGIEGKEAAVHYALILGMAVAALVVAIFGYFFLVIALVFLIAWLCGGGNAWIWVMFAAAFLHLGLMAALLLLAKSKLMQPMFSASLEELKKDQLWLKTPANFN